MFYSSVFKFLTSLVCSVNFCVAADKRMINLWLNSLFSIPIVSDTCSNREVKNFVLIKKILYRKLMNVLN